MDGGDFDTTAKYVHHFLRRDPFEVEAMGDATDVASGVSSERLRKFHEQARTALLGDTLNFPTPQLIDVLDVPDLGDAFRSPATSPVPALFLTGTLDGRTYPESHLEIIGGFPNAIHVTIENAGHNLFMSDPRISEIIVRFMGGEAVADQTLTIAPPDMTN